MTDHLSQDLTEKDSIVIVGSTGRMGSMLLREGAAHGLGMTGIDKPLDNLEPLRKAQLVIVCVPAAVFEQTLHTICPAMPKTAVLCDITSVKVAPVAQMLHCWSGDIVGTHPLFGPQHGMDEELPIALVRTRRCSDASFDLVWTLCEILGWHPFATDADTHDRAMARIQNMNFITSPFRRRLVAARKLLTEDGAMFAGLFEANPYSQQAVRQFSKLLSLASAGDIDLLLSKARRWWTGDSA